MIPRPMIILGIILLLASWFLLVERQNFWEKIGIIVGIVVIYVSFRLMTGSNVDQILLPFIQFFR